MSSKRVGIIGLLQESNTFIERKTTLQQFEGDLFLIGDAILEQMADAPHEVGGFLEALETSDIEAVPIFLARAIPYGIIESGAFDSLISTMLNELRKAGPLDGILAAPHGATVAENHPDADGHWLSEVRKAVGPGVPIVATIDPHANLSQTMVNATDAIIAYSTNPHLDQRETGLKAAGLMTQILKKDVRPVQSAAFPSMAINIQSQDTSQSPLSDLYQTAQELAQHPDVLSHSIVLGFPYADVPEMGSSVIVVTDNNTQLAKETSQQISDVMWERRNTFEPSFMSPETAVMAARETADSPTVLLDMGDNVGGGSSADGTILLKELHNQKANHSFVCVYDQEAVEKSIQAGVDAVIDLSIGGKTDSIHGSPFTGSFRVLSLHEGTFTETQARHGGIKDYDQGPTAIVETTDTHITVMLSSKRVPPFSLNQITAFGLIPETFKIIVAKGVIAPLAAYRPIAHTFIHVDTPGVTRADITKLNYTNRRKPMFPFENPIHP